MAIKTPEGMYDMLPDKALYWEHFKAKARDVFGRSGYVLIDTPIVEQTDLFVRGIGEATDVVSKEMFTAISGPNLQKVMDGERLRSSSRLSMRPEGTAGVVRACVQHDLVPQGAAPAKLIYAGPMFRAERPQHGRQRQFNQIGVECLGADSPMVDAEAIIMLVRFFEEAGIPDDRMRLLVNSMGCENCRPAYREKVRDYLEGHSSELCETCKERMDINPLRAFDCKEPSCKKVMEGAPKITDHLCEDCKEHYSTLKDLLDMAGISYHEDPSLVRGLDYYTRTVFEIQEAGSDRSQNAIGGGGRYDKLCEDVGGRPTPGFGFALGFERCALLLEDCGMSLQSAKRCDAFIACVGDDVRKESFELMLKLREEGLCVETDYQARSLKGQFKLADKLGAKTVVVLGPDELSQGKVKVRNMQDGQEQLSDIGEVAKAIQGML